MEDVAQEVFLRLYCSLDQLKTPEVFETWLYRLTVNAAYEYLRTRWRHESRQSNLSEQQVVMADAAAGHEANRDQKNCTRISELVDELLSGVSKQDAILLKLKEFEGKSLKSSKASTP